MHSRGHVTGTFNIQMKQSRETKDRQLAIQSFQTTLFSCDCAISQPDFLIAQHEWVIQIHNTRVVIRVWNRCFALYDVKNTKQNYPCLPVWYVFSSFRWAGCSTAIAFLLARNLTSIIRALVVFVQSALPYCSRDPTTQFFTKSL